MCRDPMVVLRMDVVAVGVDVQRSALSDGRGQDHAEQDHDEAMHDPESTRAVECGQTDMVCRAEAKRPIPAWHRPERAAVSFPIAPADLQASPVGSP